MKAFSMEVITGMDTTTARIETGGNLPIKVRRVQLRPLLTSLLFS